MAQQDTQTRPDRARPVSVLDEITGELDTHMALVNELEMRLAPVLRPDYPMEAPSVERNSMIASLADNAQRHSIKLRQIIDRLEI